MSAEAMLKRAYELGRARVAVMRALVLALVSAIVATLAVSHGAAVWAFAVLVAIAFTQWRGGALARGAVRGFGAGLVSLVLPTTLLRPCCDATAIAAGSCCTMPSVCGLSGAVLGVAMALVWPREKTSRDHMLAGAGIAIGALSVASARCAGLFLGEALGLALGLLAGVAASTAARAWMGSRSGAGAR